MTQPFKTAAAYVLPSIHERCLVVFADSLNTMGKIILKIVELTIRNYLEVLHHNVQYQASKNLLDFKM